MQADGSRTTCHLGESALQGANLLVITTVIYKNITIQVQGMLDSRSMVCTLSEQRIKDVE